MWVGGVYRKKNLNVSNRVFCVVSSVQPADSNVLHGLHSISRSQQPMHYEQSLAILNIRYIYVYLVEHVLRKLFTLLFVL